MSNLNTITYAIHREEGYVVSRVGREMLWPILEYEKIGQDGDFTKPLEYRWEKIPLPGPSYDWQMLEWTKKIPVSIKNFHREKWGMKPLKVTPDTLVIEEAEIVQNGKQRILRVKFENGVEEDLFRYFPSEMVSKTQFRARQFLGWSRAQALRVCNRRKTGVWYP